MMRGDLTLINDVIDRHDAINETKTNIVSVAPATADQVRQTTVATATNDLVNVDAQAALNDSQRRQNEFLMNRAIDCSNPLTADWLYSEIHPSGMRILSANSVTEDRYERAVIPLSDGTITASDLLYRRDLEAAMWSLIVRYHNEAAQAHLIRAERTAQEQKDGEQQAVMNQLRAAVTYLTNQLNTVVMATNLREYINTLSSGKWIDEMDARVSKLSERAGRLGQDGDDIRSYIAVARHNANVMGGTFASAVARILDPFNPDDNKSAAPNIEVINSHLTAVGLNMQSYFDGKFAIDALRTIHTILRANLVSMAGAPIVNPVNVFVTEQDKEDCYYKTLSEMSPDTNSRAQEYAALVPNPDDFDDDGIFYLASEGVAPKLKKSRAKKAATTTTTHNLATAEVITVAKSLTPVLRAAIAEKINDLLNQHPLVIAPWAGNNIINVYIGQYGWAPFITPVYKDHGQLYIHLTTGEFRDTSIYHLHAAGTFYLNTTAADHLLTTVVRPAVSNYPMRQTTAPAGFGFLYKLVDEVPPYHTRVIRRITAALGEVLISVALPTDSTMRSWRTFMPGDILAA